MFFYLFILFSTFLLFYYFIVCPAGGSSWLTMTGVQIYPYIQYDITSLVRVCSIPATIRYHKEYSSIIVSVLYTVISENLKVWGWGTVGYVTLHYARTPPPPAAWPFQDGCEQY